MDLESGRFNFLPVVLAVDLGVKSGVGTIGVKLESVGRCALGAKSFGGVAIVNRKGGGGTNAALGAFAVIGVQRWR